MVQLGQYTYAQDLLQESQIKDPALQNKIKAAIAQESKHNKHQKILEEEVQRHDPQLPKASEENISLYLLIFSTLFFGGIVGYRSSSKRLHHPSL